MQRTWFVARRRPLLTIAGSLMAAAVLAGCSLGGPRPAAEEVTLPAYAPQSDATTATVAAPGIPLEEMTGRLAETMTVGDNDLRALATARAEQVRNYLLNTGHIAGERLFLAQATDAAKQAKGPRVFLSLQ